MREGRQSVDRPRGSGPRGSVRSGFAPPTYGPRPLEATRFQRERSPIRYTVGPQRPNESVRPSADRIAAPAALHAVGRRDFGAAAYRFGTIGYLPVRRRRVRPGHGRNGRSTKRRNLGCDGGRRGTGSGQFGPPKRRRISSRRRRFARHLGRLDDRLRFGHRGLVRIPDRCPRWRPTSTGDHAGPSVGPAARVSGSSAAAFFGPHRFACSA